MSGTVPIVMGPSGAQPTPPAVLLAQLIALVSASNPGYAATLPGSLIDDISGTDVGALVICDQALVELINSITPFGANEFLLNQLGQVYGVPIGANTNTSVPAVFTGTVGFVIPPGFTISDGTYLYVAQAGGIVPSGGTTSPIYCVATQPGTWAVPTNTVTQIKTSVPIAIALSVTNPTPGIPSAGPETAEAYRVRVLQAGLASAQGMPTLLRALLSDVAGVQTRLISITNKSPGWLIQVGGGDPYEAAFAIFQALFDTSTLVGSVLGITGVTKANPGVITTDLTHGFTTGQVIGISGVVGMTALNGTTPTITVISPKTFSIGVDTTGFSTYVSGGVITPNLRNTVVSINDYPDTYPIPFVVPLQEIVTIGLTWNTIATNLISPTAVAALGAPALASYINSIPAGQPINLFELESVFQIATANIIPTALLTKMVFAVTIDGVSVSPTAGTGIIAGDPQSYLFTTAAQITVTQG